MKRNLVLVSLLLWTSLIANAEIISETREAKVSITLSGRGDISIKGSDRYISVSSWNKNEVEVFAKVEYKGKKEEKVDEFLNNFEEIVNQNIQKAGNNIDINTNLDEPNKLEIGSRLFQVVVIGYENDELFISYEIKVPENADLKIKNSYKDLEVKGKYTRKVEIDHYSGDFEGGDFNELELELKYGDATINSITNAEMTLYEQKMEVNSVFTAMIEAKYSDLTFNSAEKMECDSYETDLIIGSGELLEGEMKYGNVEISENIDKIQMNSLYETDFKVKKAREIIIDKTRYGKFTGGLTGSLIMSESYEDYVEFKSCGYFKTESKYTKIKLESLDEAIEIKDSYETDISIGALGNDAKYISIDGKYMKLDFSLNDVDVELDLEVKYAELDYPKDLLKKVLYIKEGSILTMKLVSDSKAVSPVQISLRGYEVEVDID